MKSARHFANTMMRVLVGCEMSGRVRDAFIRKGHDAVSCDLKPSMTPGPHIQGDVLDVLGDGWDMAIFFPDCTYLTGSAEWAYTDGPYHQKVKPGTPVGAERRELRVAAVAFVKRLMSSQIKRKALENPVGVLSRLYRKPDQIIHPYHFGEDASKRTCLWLDNLPKLRPTGFVEPRMVNGKPRWGNQTDSGQNRLGPSNDRAEIRSLTYPGIAAAMAEQWG